MIRFILFWFLFLSSIMLPAYAGIAPNVVVSIKPIHSLVAGLMQGVGKPGLLLKGFDSPHTYQLKPGDAKLLANADLVVWVGFELEGFLQRPIRQLADKAVIITLLDVPGMTILSSRSAKHGHATHRHDDHRFLTRDPHLWLDSSNAIHIVNSVRDRLIKLDPSNEKIYTNNATKMLSSLQSLEQEVINAVKPVRHLRMIAFHDTWQYLEKRFGLNIVRHVISDPGRVPGTRQVAMLDSLFENKGVDCLLTEPQFKPHFLQNLLREHPVTVITLDPLGSGIQAGVDAYVKLIRQIGQDLQQCLPR
ncbi:MAG: hypothetical protein EP297_13480 [Gammaproteobacteria bacterium]|nr:MAG: hypothetical protein EP297_13480 [Gammaproteobacteria bacterium]